MIQKVVYKHPHTYTHTNTTTEWLCTMNINYSAVSEFLVYHLTKAPFTSTQTS
jgi:hypothetical protein